MMIERLRDWSLKGCLLGPYLFEELTSLHAPGVFFGWAGWGNLLSLGEIWILDHLSAGNIPCSPLRIFTHLNSCMSADSFVRCSPDIGWCVSKPEAELVLSDVLTCAFIQHYPLRLVLSPAVWRPVVRNSHLSTEHDIAEGKGTVGGGRWGGPRRFAELG